jgi:copper(I)-binding protein
MFRDDVVLRPLGRRAFIRAAATAGLAAGFAVRGEAHSYTRNGLFIGHLWSPPEEGSADLQVYGPILNREKTDDALIAAHSDVAEAVRFVQVANGKTSELKEIPLPPGKPVTLAAWTTHIVLVGMKQPPKIGAFVPFTLVFRHAGKFDVKTLVEHEPSD